MMNENSAAIRLILREESDSIERKERLLLLSALLCAEAGLVHMLSAALPGAGVSAAAALALLFALSAALLLLAKGNRTLLFGCGALLMAGLFTLPLFRSGLLALVNGFRSALCACTGCIILPLEGADEGRSAYALWVLLAYFALLLCASVLGSGRLGAALSLLPFLLFWAVGFVPVDGGAALYLFGVGTLLLRGRGGRNAVAALLCLLLCLSAAFGLQVQSGLPDSLRIALHALRYDSETNAMPEGDLSTLGSFRKSDTPALTVTMETPQKLYLRGFTGESYTGQSWEPLTNAEKAPWSESFYALHESGYYALSAIGTAAEVTDSLRPAEISVTNESACSARLYLPYGLMGNGLLDASAIGDSTAPPGKSWSGKMSSGSVPDWFTLRASLSVMSSDPGVSAYLRREQLYRSFAESEYLRVPEETAAVLAEAIDLPEGGYTLSEIKDCILTVLKDRMCYDESESLRLGEQDFAACVLENEMAGYSVHYATLAALMLRTLGVPARYVEGYYLSAEEAAQYTGGEPVTLTENHAHAWAEYYLDGVGWIPFETTPPYIDEEELNAGPGTGEERKRIYEPPKAEPTVVEEPQELHRIERDTELERRLVLYVLPLLILALLAVLIVMLSKRRRALLRTLAAMDSADNREAIVLRYGYALELLRHVSLSEEQRAELRSEQAAELNREALFSLHPMGEEQRRFMEDYAGKIASICLSQSSLLRRMRLRYVDALLR